MRRSFWIVLAGLLALVAATFQPTTARAWGKEGHETVALIAAARLSPAAAAQVKALLGADLVGGMIDAATWPDGKVKQQRPETRPWHYVDVPVGTAGYDAARDCKNHDCVVDQISIAASRAADRSLLKPVRAEALKFLIHFVGDIHQPLHAAENDGDGGGNEVFVSIGGRLTKLHALWDTAVVEELSSDRTALAQMLTSMITPAQADAWSRGTSADWTNESFSIAGTHIYQKLGITGKNTRESPIVLPASYFDDVEAVTKRQLAKAGVRLAWMLNNIFQ